MALDAERRLLANRTYRRLLVGKLVSTVGDALYRVAAVWLVFELTGSTLFTGLAGFLSQAPAVLRAFLGPVVDRAPLGRVLWGSQAVLAAIVLVVPVAALAGALSAPVVLAVMPALGLVAQLPGPAQNAAIPRIVDDDEVVTANSIDTAASGAVNAGGRAAAGAFVAAFGALAAYVLDAATFLLAAALFVAAGLPAVRDDDGDAAYTERLLAGARLVVGTPVGGMVAAAALASLLTGASLAVFPAYAAGIGGASAYGLLLGATSAGAVAGSLAATRLDGVPLGRVAVAGFAAGGAVWSLAVAAGGLVPTALLFALAWLPTGAYNVLVLGVVQTGVPDGAVGRVSALAGTVTGLAGPVGMLAGGAVGDAVGARPVLYAAGIGLFAGAAYWLASPRLRRFPPPNEVAPGSFGDDAPPTA